MSQLSSTANQPGHRTTQKQRINVYTMMLIVAFIAVTLASVAMYFVLQKYGEYPWWDTKEADPSKAEYRLPNNLPTRASAMRTASLMQPNILRESV